jgi:hypothetical protein
MPSTHDHCVVGSGNDVRCDSNGATGPVSFAWTYYGVDNEYKDYCSNLRQGGRSDWRPATFRELIGEAVRGSWNTNFIAKLAQHNPKMYDKVANQAFKPPVDLRTAQYVLEPYVNENVLLPAICVVGKY